jgi:hypothetical protein
VRERGDGRHEGACCGGGRKGVGVGDGGSQDEEASGEGRRRNAERRREMRGRDLVGYEEGRDVEALEEDLRSTLPVARGA